MKYLIAVLNDRIQAESAYTALEKAGIAPQQLAIIGRGYKTADEFGLIDISEQAKKGAIRMAFWLIPFGFAAGYTFDLITGLDTFSWAGEPGNHILGGLLGSMGGAMGSVFIGGGVGLTAGRGDALPYQKLFKADKYLVSVKGSDALQNKAREILTQFNPEIIKSYMQEELVN